MKRIVFALLMIALVACGSAPTATTDEDVGSQREGVTAYTVQATTPALTRVSSSCVHKVPNNSKVYRTSTTSPMYYQPISGGTVSSFSRCTSGVYAATAAQIRPLASFTWQGDFQHIPRTEFMYFDVPYNPPSNSGQMVQWFMGGMRGDGSIYEGVIVQYGPNAAWPSVPANTFIYYPYALYENGTVVMPSSYNVTAPGRQVLISAMNPDHSSEWDIFASDGVTSANMNIDFWNGLQAFVIDAISGNSMYDSGVTSCGQYPSSNYAAASSISVDTQDNDYEPPAYYPANITSKDMFFGTFGYMPSCAFTGWGDNFWGYNSGNLWITWTH